MWVRTSTATWPGRIGSRPRASPSLDVTSTSASEESSDTRSAATFRGDVLARGVHVGVACPGEYDRLLVAMHYPHPQRRGVRRATQPRSLVGAGRPYAAIDDSLVPELSATEQSVVGVDQTLIAAPVDVERRPRSGGLRRVEVGVDVGAAEGVNRLLPAQDACSRDRGRGADSPASISMSSTASTGGGEVARGLPLASLLLSAFQPNTRGGPMRRLTIMRATGDPDALLAAKREHIDPVMTRRAGEYGHISHVAAPDTGRDDRRQPVGDRGGI